jgi:hypothetical protein
MLKLHAVVLVLFGLLSVTPQTTLAKDAKAVDAKAVDATKVIIVADTGNASRLCGRIKQEVRWGPPGFGETPKRDARRLAWIVKLQRSATFRHKSDAGKPIDEAISRVQISVPSSESRLAVRRMTGRAVMLEGPVWSASSEGDVTPVVIQMASVSKLTRSTPCDH